MDESSPPQTSPPSRIPLILWYALFTIYIFVVGSILAYIPRVALPHEQRAFDVYLPPYAPPLTTQAVGASAGFVLLCLIPFVLTVFYANLCYRRGLNEKLKRKIALFSLIPIVPSSIAAFIVFGTTQQLIDWAGLVLIYMVVAYSIGELIALPIIGTILGALVEKSYEKPAIITIARFTPLIIGILIAVYGGYTYVSYAADWKSCGLANGITLRRQNNAKCLAAMAQEQGNPSVCEGAKVRGGISGPGSCYFALATSTKNPKMCTKISNTSMQNDCLAQLDRSGTSVSAFIPQQNTFRYTDLEKALAEPTKVVILHLNQPSLTEVPSSIGDFPNLEELHLAGTKITGLPPEIAKLQKLEILNLSETKNLTVFPREILALTNLKKLIFYLGGVTEIPPDIKQLQNLESLDLGWLKITSLPKELADMPKLKELGLQMNSIDKAQLKETLPNIRINSGPLYPYTKYMPR